jgi:protein-L-isoaspartate(D-aspartate) O-methyltransferase
MASSVSTPKSNPTANANLIHSLQGYRYIKSVRVANVMSSVDRGLFSRHNPYADSPQTIGYGATISAPHMHAISLELLSDRLIEGATVLDVGSGSGYLTACMSLMVGPTGTVIGIEHIDELVQTSIKNIRHIAELSQRLDDGRLKIVKGDGRHGYSSSAPYDVIHVGAAAPEIPQVLIDQLRPGTGRLLVPVGGPTGSQKLLQFDKVADGHVTKKKHMSVSFVPLTSKKHQTWT